MKISVVIPTMNRVDLVGRAIESVLNQSYPVHELIVVDDGSTDQTVGFIKTNFPEVSLISQHNSGVSSARNTGIRTATGNWIAFLDSDDAWGKQKLELQVEALTGSPEFEISHTDEIWIRNSIRVNPKNKHAKPNGWIFKQCLPLCCVSPSSVLIKRGVLEDIGLFDEELPVCEDYDLWLRIFSRYPVLLVTGKLLTKYGGHEDQLSRKYWGMDRFRVKALNKILDENILQSGDRKAARNMLLKKLTILINGYTKREKSGDLSKYQKMFDLWSKTD